MSPRVSVATMVLAAFCAACELPAAPEAQPGAVETGFAAAQASHVLASGTSTQTGLHSLTVGQAGPNTVIEQTSEGTLTGTLAGAFDDEVRVVIHPNGTFTTRFTITCACTVDGRSGTVVLTATDSGEMVSEDEAVFSGRAVITGASGELSGLHGVLEIAGTVHVPSGLSTWDYEGSIHFR